MVNLTNKQKAELAIKNKADLEKQKIEQEKILIKSSLDLDLALNAQRQLHGRVKKLTDIQRKELLTLISNKEWVIVLRKLEEYLV